MLIFDLEYYLPEKDREDVPYGIDPSRNDHIILGGTFIERKKPSRKEDEKRHNFWIWNYENETEMLSDIHKLIMNHEPEKNQYTSFLGHGIADSDIPTLTLRWDKLGVSSFYQTFLELKRYSILDLASIGAVIVPQPEMRVVGHKKLAENIFGSTWKLEDSQTV